MIKWIADFCRTKKIVKDVNGDGVPIIKVRPNPNLDEVEILVPLDREKNVRLTHDRVGAVWAGVDVIPDVCRMITHNKGNYDEVPDGRYGVLKLDRCITVKRTSEISECDCGS